MARAEMVEMAKDLCVQQEINGYVISTSDLRYGPGSYNIVETMVFAGSKNTFHGRDLYCRRYDTWQEAIKDRERVVEMVKKAKRPGLKFHLLHGVGRALRKLSEYQDDFETRWKIRSAAHSLEDHMGLKAIK